MEGVNQIEHLKFNASRFHTDVRKDIRTDESTDDRADVLTDDCKDLRMDVRTRGVKFRVVGVFPTNLTNVPCS